MLLEKEELTGKELEKIVLQYPARPLKKPVTPDVYEVYAQEQPSPLSIKQNGVVLHEEVVETVPPIAERTEKEACAT